MTNSTLIKNTLKSIQTIGIVGGQAKNVEFGLMTLLNSSIFVKFQEDQVNLLENIQNSILSYLRGQQAQNLLTEKEFFNVVSWISYSPYIEDLKNCDIIFEDSVDQGADWFGKIHRIESILKEDGIFVSRQDFKSMETCQASIQKKTQFFGIKFSEKEGHDNLI